MCGTELRLWVYFPVGAARAWGGISSAWTASQFVDRAGWTVGTDAAWRRVNSTGQTCPDSCRIGIFVGGEEIRAIGPQTEESEGAARVDVSIRVLFDDLILAVAPGLLSPAQKMLFGQEEALRSRSSVWALAQHLEPRIFMISGGQGSPSSRRR